MRRAPWYILLIGASLALAPRSAPGLEFTSTLSSIKVHVRRGEVVTRAFELHLTPGQAATRFRSHVEDWWQSEDGARSFYRPPGTLARSCGTWITLDPIEISVAAGDTLRVRITATVPRAATPGGYWCVLTVDQLPDPLANDEGVDMRFAASVSTGIFLYLDPVQRDVRISAIGISAHRARITLRNAGNAPVAVDGRILLFRAGDRQPVAEVALKRMTVLTEPISTRRVTADLPDLSALPAGRYVVQVVLDLGLDHDIAVQKQLVLPDDLERPGQDR